MFMDDEIMESLESSTETSEVATPVAEKPKTSEVPYSRFKEVVDERNKLKEELASFKIAPKPEVNREVPADFQSRLDRIELRSMGYAPEEVDHVMAVGGLKALENPIIKSGIESMRSQKKAEQGTPAPAPRVVEERPVDTTEIPSRDKPFDRKAYFQKKQLEALEKAKAAGRLRVG